MKTLEIRTKIHQKLDNLSPEQLNSVWEFLESLESPIEPNKNPKKTVLEKMGGYPKSLLSGTGNLSDRDVRQKIIAEKIQNKHHYRHQ